MQHTLFSKPEDQSAETAAQLVAHVSLSAMAQHESLARAQAFERHRLFRLLVGELIALFAADPRARVTLGPFLIASSSATSLAGGVGPI